MSKRMKILVAVLVAVVLLTMGGVAAVMADEGSTATSNATSTNSLQARVAEKLGVTEEELANAFSEARQEMRGEAFIKFLDKALEKGRITESDYDEITEWWDARPKAIDSLFPSAFGAPGLAGRHMGGGYKFTAPWGGHMRGGPKGWCSDNTT